MYCVMSDVTVKNEHHFKYQIGMVGAPGVPAAEPVEVASSQGQEHARATAVGAPQLKTDTATQTNAVEVELIT